MIGRFPTTHAALLGTILAITGYIFWSALSASTSLNNLIVAVPVAAILALLAVVITVSSLRKPKVSDVGAPKSLWGDLLLLAGFALFCFALTKIGFDIATFIFVWIGIVMSGGKSLWQPPLFAALFTLFLVKGFGSLFPYPMLTLVL